MAKKSTKKHIKINLKSSSAQGIVEQEIHSALQNRHSVAIVGTVDSLIFTDGMLNTIFDDLFTFLSSAGNRLEFFIDQKTSDEMRKMSRQNWLMNRHNVIIHIISDWANWSPGELEMKFDVIIANPPYCSGLHLKILRDLMLLSDNIVCIHPANWLQFPTKQRPAFMNGRIGDFQIIDRNEANEMFDIGGGDIVISTFIKNGLSFMGSPVSDPRFCCFKFNSRFDY